YPALFRSASHETDAPAMAVEAKLDEVPAADRKLGVEDRPLRDVANRRITSSGGPSENLELAGGGREPAEDRADQGRLPRSVRAQDRRERARLDVEGGARPH